MRLSHCAAFVAVLFAGCNADSPIVMLSTTDSSRGTEGTNTDSASAGSDVSGVNSSDTTTSGQSPGSTETGTQDDAADSGVLTAATSSNATTSVASESSGGSTGTGWTDGGETGTLGSGSETSSWSSTSDSTWDWSSTGPSSSTDDETSSSTASTSAASDTTSTEATGTSSSTTGASESSTGDSSTTGDPPPVCGNTITEFGEECDDGNTSNADACTNACKLATCGDGHLQGSESCDDGNTAPGDGCHSDCTTYKLVFVTSTLKNGNIGGMAGANSWCQGLATAAGLSGSFKAWLSVGTTQHAKDNLSHAAIPYRLRNGALIANNWSDLTDGTIATAIDRTETNAVIPTTEGGACVRPAVHSNTNTTGTGLGTAGDCNGWTINVGNAHYGLANANNKSWTDHVAATGCITGCGTANRIYCFQQ